MTGPRVQKSQKRRSTSFQKIEKSALLPQIIEKLEANVGFDHVAIWIQEQGEFKDIQSRSLGKQLNRFWKAYGESSKQAVAIVEKNRRTDIEELAKLEELAELQKARIDQLRKTEEKLPTLFPNFRQDIAEYRGILHLLIDKKAALGLYGKATQAATKPEGEGGNVTNVTVHQTNNTQVNIDKLDDRMKKVVTDDKSRRKILNVIERFSKDERTPEEAFKKRYHLGSRVGDENDGPEAGTVIDVEPEAASE